MFEESFDTYDLITVRYFSNDWNMDFIIQYQNNF